MDIRVRLRGWADDLSENHKKLEFPLQAAMYEIIGDCDWYFKIDTKGSDVRLPWQISVTAERCCSYSSGRRKIGRTFQRYEFAFEVPSYTVANVYEGAIKELKKLKSEGG